VGEVDGTALAHGGGVGGERREAVARWYFWIFGCGAVVIRAGGRREGAKERAVVHSAAATAAAHSAVVAKAHDT
jgi:hypothetical protein